MKQATNLKARQIKAARALLDWSQENLSAASSLSVATIRKLELGYISPRSQTTQLICSAFENAGIEFLDDDGAQLKNDRIVTLKGENIFFRVLDDVIATLRNAKSPEALFACVNDGLSPPVVIENYRRLRKAKIAMRSLVQENDTYLMGKLSEYRSLPTEFFHNSTMIIYGNKVATMILDPDTKADVGAIIIRNPHVAAAQRNLFNLIWSNARQPSVTNAEVRYDE